MKIDKVFFFPAIEHTSWNCWWWILQTGEGLERIRAWSQIPDSLIFVFILENLKLMKLTDYIGSRTSVSMWLCVGVLQDQFVRAAPLQSGIGMALLQKMGWKQGTGLGKNNEGSIEPLALDFKTDRRGE